MAEKKRNAGRWLLIVLVLCILSCLACCCGCAGLWHFLPDMLIAAFTEEQPLEAPTVQPDPATAPLLEQAFRSEGAVRMTGEQLVQLVEPWDNDELYAFWVGVHEDDTVELTLSAYIADIDRYVNVQGRAGFELEHGWWTDFRVDQLVVSGWDLGQYTRGQQLAQHANRSMADQRAQNPEVAVALDQVQHLWIRDGAIWVELVPGGWEIWRSMRQ